MMGLALTGIIIIIIIIIISLIKWGFAYIFSFFL